MNFRDVLLYMSTYYNLYIYIQNEGPKTNLHSFIFFQNMTRHILMYYVHEKMREKGKKRMKMTIKKWRFRVATVFPLLFQLLLQPTPRTQQSHKNLNIQRKYSKFSLLHDSTTHYTLPCIVDKNNNKFSISFKFIPEKQYLFYIMYLCMYVCFMKKKKKKIKMCLVQFYISSATTCITFSACIPWLF